MPYGGILEQPAADSLQKGVTEQEIAVAVHQVQRHTGIAQRAQAGNLLRIQRHIGVIANPQVEQVAHDVNGVGAACRTGQESQEDLRELRAGGLEVQVGNEQCRHAAPGSVL
jgi:hypothetical protein